MFQGDDRCRTRGEFSCRGPWGMAFGRSVAPLVPNPPPHTAGAATYSQRMVLTDAVVRGTMGLPAPVCARTDFECRLAVLDPPAGGRPGVRSPPETGSVHPPLIFVADDPGGWRGGSFRGTQGCGGPVGLLPFTSTRAGREDWHARRCGQRLAESENRGGQRDTQDAPPVRLDVRSAAPERRPLLPRLPRLAGGRPRGKARGSRH